METMLTLEIKLVGDEIKGFAKIIDYAIWKINDELEKGRTSSEEICALSTKLQKTISIIRN